MFKRFLIGFLIGIGVMYWWIHRSERTFTDAQSWMEKSASGYRGDREHMAVQRETGK
jgi:hypothetical protein